MTRLIVVSVLVACVAACGPPVKVPVPKHAAPPPPKDKAPSELPSKDGSPDTPSPPSGPDKPGTASPTHPGGK